MPGLIHVPLILTTFLLLTRKPVETTTAENFFNSDTLTKNWSPIPELEEDDWRDTALIYHIDPRSFQDSDGDGEGDFKGIVNRLKYLVSLKIDTIRLSSIYSTSGRNSGYGVLNYTDIDSIYGNFDDFYELIQNAHDNDIKVILDINLNHSDDQHEWFLSSVTSTKPYDDYYIWADGKILNNKVVPPNNWKSLYSDEEGSAWTWHTQRKQWYYHKFYHTEPDINLRNENVIQEILAIFDFWLEKGIDGFCICGVSYFFENKDLFDESSEENHNSKLNYIQNNDDDVDDCTRDDVDNNDSDNVNDHCNNDTVIQHENAALLYRFREHIDEWVKKNNNTPKLIVGQISEYDTAVSSYYGNETHRGIIPLNLIFINKLNDSINADNIKNLIKNYLDDLPKDVNTNWMLSNQDYSRAASRLNPDLLDGLYMITLLLPGQAIIYYGEEIGMLDTNISLVDTSYTKTFEKTENDYFQYSKDKVRTPMQWNNTTSAGFSTNKTTFLPVNSNYININVEKQLYDTDSNLVAFKKLAILRKEPIFINGDYDLNTSNDNNIFILTRSLDNDTCITIINFGSSMETINLTAIYPNFEENLQVIIDSSNANVEKDNDKDKNNYLENDSLILAANAAAVLCENDHFKDSQYETTTNAMNNDNDDENDEDISIERKSNNLTSSSTEDFNSEAEASVNGSSKNIRQELFFNIIIYLLLGLLLQES